MSGGGEREIGSRAGGARGRGRRAVGGFAGPGGAGERGSLAIEAAILAPAIVLLFSLVVIIGQLEQASGSVHEGARVAARTITLTYSANESDQQLNQVARTAVERSLTQNGLDCAGLTVQATREPLQTSVTLQTIKVDVKCTVKVNDLFVTGVPGEVEFDQSFTSVVDYYRPQ